MSSRTSSDGGAPTVREELHGSGSWMKEWMQVLKALASYGK